MTFANQSVPMYHFICAGPPPVHQLIRNDKTEKSPTVSVSSAPTFSSVLRPEDGHRGLESPHSQTGMYPPGFSNCLLRRGCELLENTGSRPIICMRRADETSYDKLYILINITKISSNFKIFSAVKLSNGLDFFFFFPRDWIIYTADSAAPF